MSLPGDLSKQQKLERMIRVNHAGEYGAKRIYSGQLAVLKDKESQKTISHMAEQEQEHLDYFADQIAARQVRPTAMMPIWHVAGYAMGAVTALMGKEAAMACTVAVEEAIDEHYKEQVDELDRLGGEDDLKQKIEQFRQEELEHRDIGIENDAEKAAAYPVLYDGVRAATKFAIWISKRV